MFLSDYEIIKSKKHLIPIDPYEYKMFINIECFGNDIYFIKYSYPFIHSQISIFPYLEKDDILIEDFEKYINSYRQVKTTTSN
jgi:hypothetical protein